MSQALRLIECTTLDHLVHQGFFYEPQKKGKIALVWVHGLTGNFYRNFSLHRALIAQCKKHGWAYLSCNTRGHDMLASIRKVDNSTDSGFTRIPAGAGQEIFTDCVYDIQAYVQYLGTLGYSRMILIGHSTGANKVCYYSASYPYDARVAGVVLMSPIRDRLTVPSYMECILWIMKRLVALGLGKRPLFVPGVFFPITPYRYVSLFSCGSPEDVFTYGDKPSRSMHMVSGMKHPAFVVFGEEDEMADRPVALIQKEFDSQVYRLAYTSTRIAGSDHGFEGYEHTVAGKIAGFIRTVLVKK